MAEVTSKIQKALELQQSISSLEELIKKYKSSNEQVLRFLKKDIDFKTNVLAKSIEYKCSQSEIQGHQDELDALQKQYDDTSGIHLKNIEALTTRMLCFQSILKDLKEGVFQVIIQFNNDGKNSFKGICIRYSDTFGRLCELAGEAIGIKPDDPVKVIGFHGLYVPAFSGKPSSPASYSPETLISDTAIREEQSLIPKLLRLGSQLHNCPECGDNKAQTEKKQSRQSFG